MKIISCSHCGARKIGPKSGQFPNGVPVVFGRWTGRSNAIVVKCHRCTNAMKLTAVDFNRLPVATPEELKEFGLSPQLAVQ